MTRFTIWQTVRINTADTNKNAQRVVFHESLPSVMVGTVRRIDSAKEGGEVVWIQWQGYGTVPYDPSVLVEAQE